MRYLDALEQYQLAYEKLPLPDTLYNIVQCYQRMKRQSEALRYFERFVALQPTGEGAEDARAQIKILRGTDQLPKYSRSAQALPVTFVRYFDRRATSGVYAGFYATLGRSLDRAAHATVASGILSTTATWRSVRPSLRRRRGARRQSGRALLARRFVRCHGRRSNRIRQGRAHARRHASGIWHRRAASQQLAAMRHLLT